MVKKVFLEKSQILTKDRQSCQEKDLLREEEEP